MTTTPQSYTFNPALLAFLFNRYRVEGEALLNVDFSKRITHGSTSMRLSPNTLRSLNTPPEDIPSNFRFTLVAYILHHVTPLRKRPTTMHLYQPEDFKPWRISRNAQVVHISYNRADFSKDNLKLVYLA